MASSLFRYLPAIGRFLIVVTFIEDSLRMITQWNDQLLYLRDYRKSKHGFGPVPPISGLTRRGAGSQIDSNLGFVA